MTGHFLLGMDPVYRLEAELEIAQAQVDWYKLQLKSHGIEPAPPPRLTEAASNEFLAASFRRLDEEKPKRMKQAVSVQIDELS